MREKGCYSLEERWDCHCHSAVSLESFIAAFEVNILRNCACDVNLKFRCPLNLQVYEFIICGFNEWRNNVIIMYIPMSFWIIYLIVIVLGLARQDLSLPEKCV